MFDKGTGPPIVVIPGIQGRYEWVRPGLQALTRYGRVIAFSLADEPTSGFAWHRGDGFDRYVTQVIEAMDRAKIERATICGVSYGGLIAMAAAARHPWRVRGLVLASSLAPSWLPDARVRAYVAAPVLMAPLFVLASPWRLGPEVAAALHGWRARWSFVGAQTWRVLMAPFSPRRMARRVRMLEGLHLEQETARIETPVLVVTGDEALDRVVPVSVTREYATLCAGAQCVTLERTGHIGIVTQPERFAGVVGRFAAATQTGETTNRYETISEQTRGR